MEPVLLGRAVELERSTLPEYRALLDKSSFAAKRTNSVAVATLVECKVQSDRCTLWNHRAGLLSTSGDRIAPVRFRGLHPPEQDLRVISLIAQQGLVLKLA